MNEQFKKYIANQNKLGSLKGEYIKASLSGEQIIDKMRDVAQIQRILYAENQTILKDSYYSIIDEPTLMTMEKFIEIQEFAVELSRFLEQKDTGIAYEIHSELLKFAKKFNDPNLIIQESYYKGLVLLYLSETIYLEEEIESFGVVETYITEYTNLSKETRIIFNKAYGNYFLTFAKKRTTEYRKCISIAKDIINFYHRPDVMALDLDFPFYRWEKVTKRNVATFVDLFESGIGLDPDIVDFVYNCAKDIYDSYLNGVKTSSLPVSSIYRQYYLAQYYKGIITLKELCDKIKALIFFDPKKKYSTESRTRMMNVSAAYIYYLKKLGDTEEINKEIEKVLKDSEDYSAKMPVLQSTNSSVSDFINSAMKGFTQDEVFDQVLDLTAYRHFPTYVHINIVSIIATKLCEFAIKYCPEIFVGYFDINSEDEVIDKKDFLLDTIKKCGLIHDLGKFYVADYIFNFGRKLTEKEYKIIQSHVTRGYELISNSVLSLYCKEAVLYHHKFYDGNGGYPEEVDNTNIKSKPLVDILSISDSIEAATDQLGRPYASVKTLDDLIKEFEKEAGSRYSPYLVILIKKEEVKKAIEQIIIHDRQDMIVNAVKVFANKELN
jgi:HD-GYP domain-containing protein (c-di-GMP phosphodiesterase class II)